MGWDGRGRASKKSVITTTIVDRIQEELCNGSELKIVILKLDIASLKFKFGEEFKMSFV